MAKTAIIIGASGLIGRNLLQVLLEQPGYDEVLILVRARIDIKHKKLIQIIVDFNRLNDYSDVIKGDAIFCCIGSTKAKTPNENEYRKIDHDYPLQLAKIARGNSIGQYHVISAASADITSSVFYSRMKGEMEADLIKVGLPKLHIYRPWLLTGGRKESRPLESISIAIFKIVNPFLVGRYRKFRSISGATIAKAMYKQSLKNEDGLFIYPSDKIQELS